jgi:hypothetical protein
LANAARQSPGGSGVAVQGREDHPAGDHRHADERVRVQLAQGGAPEAWVVARLGDQRRRPAPDHLHLVPHGGQFDRVAPGQLMDLGSPLRVADEVGDLRDQPRLPQPEDHHPVQVADPGRLARRPGQQVGHVGRARRRGEQFRHARQRGQPLADRAFDVLPAQRLKGADQLAAAQALTRRQIWVGGQAGAHQPTQLAQVRVQPDQILAGRTGPPGG